LASATLMPALRLAGSTTFKVRNLGETSTPRASGIPRFSAAFTIGGISAARGEIPPARFALPGEVVQVGERVAGGVVFEPLRRQFGGVLSALPPAPRHFVLFFKFESDELTDGSRALVPVVLKTVKDRSFPEVAVVGHTDTMGAPQANIELGLKRATFVRNLLVEVGLDAMLIDVTSHGEADQLISTPDATPESRNRRVEIVVR